MSTLIQYDGFVVAGTSRLYNFHVDEVPETSRSFTVKILLHCFRSTPLRFQDGPAIAFEVLKRELASETPESRVKANLNIGEDHILEYLKRHSPRKHA